MTQPIMQNGKVLQPAFGLYQEVTQKVEVIDQKTKKVVAVQEITTTITINIDGSYNVTP